MELEEVLENEANEANMKLNEKMNDDSNIPHGAGEVSSTTETNLKIQEAFYSENDQDEAVPTYMSSNTPAIKITGNSK